ncbi:MAG: substrate-binding domain-containing protein [Verrucomicrobiota bacterium]
MAPNEKDTGLKRPVRLTLVDQVAQCIRQEVESGTWDDRVPPESELCKDYGVSRGTLRRALASLFADDVLIQGGRGERHRVNRSSKKKKGPEREKLAPFIRILSPQPRFVLGGQTQLIFQTVSELLGRSGYHLEFDYHPGLWKLKHPSATLGKIVDRPDTSGWLLYRPTKVIQHWFAKSPIPAVALGAVYPGVLLPHAGFDFPAACRHAVGLMAARKRRRLTILMVTQSTAGDEQCVDAFESACRDLGVECQVAYYDDTVDGLCRQLDSLLAGASVPDGYLVGFANHVPATIGHLNRRGCKVPEQASVISRLDARLLVESIPTVARYEVDEERLARCLARLVFQSIDSKKEGVPRTHLITPDFVDGESAGGAAS